MDKNNQNKIDIKIITLGDSRVGKSSLIVKFIENKFSSNYLSTIGFDSKHKIIKIDDENEVKLIIHDTAGQERFRSLATNYIKKANGILLVYDITEKDSFNNIGNWLESIAEETACKLPIVLVGNKSDLIEERKVTKEEGQKKADDYGFKFFETSCQNGDNVENCFICLAKEIYNKMGGKKVNQSKNHKLKKNSNSEKKKCCL